MTTETMLAAADRLAEVIAEENAAIKDRDWDRVRRLAQDKRNAVQDYERTFRALGEPDALPDRTRQRLQAAGERLAMLADENERRLTLVMFAQRRVVAAISDAVVAAGNGAATYGRTGGLNRGRAGRTPLSVSVNCAL